MAQRRMFSLQIVDTDAFLEMSQTAQLLYFHLSMRADDDGFIASPKKIMKMTGIQEDDLKILIAKRFLILFESGVVVIKHWRIHNYIRGDRYTETTYRDEKAVLSIKDNGSYTEKPNCLDSCQPLVIPNGNQMSYQMATQVRLGKDSIEKGSIGKDKEEVRKRTFFEVPSVYEIDDYIKQQKINYPFINFTGQQFFDFYESKGWMIGKNKMKCWKSAIRTWISKCKEKQLTNKGSGIKFDTSSRIKELERMGL